MQKVVILQDEFINVPSVAQQRVSNDQEFALWVEIKIDLIISKKTIKKQSECPLFESASEYSVSFKQETIFIKCSNLTN